MSEQDEIWERDDMIAALRARVAKLEAALIEAKNHLPEWAFGAHKMADAALKDAAENDRALPDEQLRAMTGGGWTTEPMTQAMAAELLDLRARVAQLEAALKEIAERRFLAETMIEIARAALKDAPQ